MAAIDIGQQQIPGLQPHTTRLHAPVPTRPVEPRRAHDVLVPSKINPRVRRWQRITAQQPLVHPSRARRVLNAAFDTPAGVPLAHSEVAHVEVQALVHEGMITMHPAPLHHAESTIAILTPRGRAHVRNLRSAQARLSTEAQRGLFKGVRFTIDVQRLAKSTVRGHYRHDKSGTHYVHEHDSATHTAVPTDPHPGTVAAWLHAASPLVKPRAALALQLTAFRARSGSGDGRWPGPEAAVKELDGTMGAAHGGQWAHWGQRVEDSIAVCKAHDWDASAIRNDPWGAAIEPLTKAQQIGLFAPTTPPIGVTEHGTGTGRHIAEVMAPFVTSTGFTALEMAALRARTGVIVPGTQQKKLRPDLAPDAEGLRTKYAITRYFYTTPKGAAPIRPVEILTREPSYFYRYPSGSLTEREGHWVSAGPKQYLHPDGTWYGKPPWGIATFRDGRTEKMEPKDMAGSYKETVPCDARCTEARGNSCDCSCGGVNHGKGSQISWVHTSAKEIRDIIREHGKPTPAELRKAQSIRPHPPQALNAPGGTGAGGQTPQQRGLHLQPSKTNPRIKRWERDAPKPTSDHVAFKDPTTGAQRVGKVSAAGAKGLTVVDHETGLQHRVAHGDYTNTEKPKDAPEPAKAKSEPQAAPEPVNHREKYPGLNKYPPKDATDIEEYDAKKHGPQGGEEDEDSTPWKLRWRASPGPDGKRKMINAYDTSDLRDNMRRKFEKLGNFGHTLGELRQTLTSHMKQGAHTEQGVISAMVRIVDHTAMRAGNESSIKQGVHGVSTLLRSHVKVDGDTVRLKYVGKSSVPQEHVLKDPQVAAIVQHLLAQPGGKDDRLFQAPDTRGRTKPVQAGRVNEYVKTHAGDQHSLKDLRTFHATRIFSEAVDKLGPAKTPEQAEANIQKGALEVAKHLGHKRGVSPGHFVQSTKSPKETTALAKEHGGQHLGNGVVGFETSKAKKAFTAAHGDGASDLAKKDVKQEIPTRYEHEGQTSLDNYIDPTVVEAYRRGMTLSNGMAKGRAAHEHLSDDERRFIDFLGKVKKADPHKFAGAKP